MLTQKCVCCFSAVKFLSALAADGTIPDVEGIISSNLGAGFDSLKESVTDSIARQEKIMAAVQVCTPLTSMVLPLSLKPFL